MASPTTAGEVPDLGHRRHGPTRVLYIAGEGRSGSTLLSRVLGQVPGVFAAGEVRYLWERGIAQQRPCECGHLVTDCAVWSPVMRRALASMAEEDAATLAARAQDHMRLRRLPEALWLRDHLASRLPSAYVDLLARLYATLPEVTGARLVVDSSKLPPYALVLQGLETVDLRIIHLVRDPRAVAFSWLRRKALPDVGGTRLMQRQHLGKSALLWNVWNRVVESLWAADPSRYALVRYEDLVASPRATVAAVLEHAGISPAEGVPFRDTHTVELTGGHAVAGNPNRFQRGTIEVRSDESWQRDMARSQRHLVSLATLPLRYRYGYHASASDGPTG